MATFATDAQGRACVTATSSDGSSVVIYEQGGHLASWKTRSGQELLYLSPKAVYADGVALRGGVPLIFPQFGSRGALKPSHGFARLRPWQLQRVDDGVVTLTLNVTADELDARATATAPSNALHRVVRLEYTVHFSNTQLKLNMRVTNASEDAQVRFHFAFHTYFAVSDIAAMRVSGLDASPYIDNRQVAAAAATATNTNNNNSGHSDAVDEDGKPLVLQRAAATSVIAGEFDRIYPQHTCAITVHDVQKSHILHVSSGNLCDVCVWNPGVDKCAALRDMPLDGYKRFVCVEHGSIVKRVVLWPSSSWVGTQEIRLLSGSSSFAAAAPAKL